MSNELIDVTIYVNKMQAFLDDQYKSPDNGIVSEYDIEDVDRFLEIFYEDIEYVATLNFYENGDPILSEEQFIDTLGKSIAQYHIDSLMEKGLVESTFDEETMEPKFRLTDEGRETAKNYPPSNGYYEFSKS